MGSAAVAILMPIAPKALWLPAALESVKSQTMPDWNLVAVVDGECAENAEALDRADIGHQLSVVELANRSGVAAALNAGLAVVDCEYVARLDADDLCEPQRLAIQVAELERRPAVWVLGTAATLIDAAGRPGSMRLMPSGPDEVRRRLAWRNALIHPSVMMRRSRIEELGGYSAQTRMEDYELWLRVIGSGGQLDNLPSPLIRLRIHPGQHSRSSRGGDLSSIRDGRRRMARTGIGARAADAKFMTWWTYQRLRARWP